MIKAVFMDIDNTLFSFDGYVRETMKKGFEEFGIAEYNDEMFDTFTRVNGELWKALERQELTFDELKKRRWNDVFAALGLSYDGVAFEEYFRTALQFSAIEIDGAKDIVEYLSGKYVLCAASNGPYAQQESRLKVGGILPYFKHLFISEAIGVSKPSVEFFSKAISILNEGRSDIIKPDEIIMIGDSLTSDMAGGVASGLKTCFFNLKKKDIVIELPIDYIITDLKEIKNII